MKRRCWGLIGVLFFMAMNAWATEWPPKLGQPYPDVELIDATGHKVRLSSFKGFVILIEPVGMTCSACQAFSGAHKMGAYQNITPQANVDSIEDYFPRYTGGLSLNDPRIVYVQILLYSMSMGAPTPEDVKKWSAHFGYDRYRNHFVFAGTPELLGDASYNMIPGFQLVDKHFILRADATGDHPKQSFGNDLLSLVPKLLAEQA